MAYNYDKKTDYTKKMQEAAAAGKWEEAALYEQQRNAKIDGEGLTQYQKSQTYARYLPTNYGYDKNVDYQGKINDAVAGGNMAAAAMFEQQRNQKIRDGNGNGYAMTYDYTDYLPGMSQQVGKEEYKNPYLEQLNASIQKLGDESELKKQYLWQADRQTEDTLGAYAANTGGIASTGAVAAAQQAGANVRGQMGQAILNQRQIYNNALMAASGLAQSEYQMKINEAMNRWTQLGYADSFVSSVLGVAPGTATSSQSYQNWQQQFQQQQADRNWESTQWQQGYQQQQADRNWENTQWQQGYQQQQADRNWENTQWQQGQSEKNQAYTMAMNILQTGGMPSPELLAAAGIDQSYADQMAGHFAQQYAYQQATQLLSAGVMPSPELLAAAGLTQQQANAMAAASATKNSGGNGGGGGGGGGSRSGGTQKPLTASNYTKLLNAYQKGDGSWVNIAKGFEQAGYDLTGFYAEVGLDPNDPYTVKEPPKTTSNPSGSVRQLVQSYRPLRENGMMGDDQLKEALWAKINSGAITVNEAMQVAKALGLEW